MIEVKGIDVSYGNINALKDVSLSVAKGQIVTVIGSNGAGKSTLLKAISGILPKKAGQVLFEGRSITELPADAICRLGMAVVPESRRLFGPMSVLDNLYLGAYARMRQGCRKEVREDIDRMFQLFPILKSRAAQKAGTLSGGEQQMLAIARALMSRPGSSADGRAVHRPCASYGEGDLPDNQRSEGAGIHHTAHRTKCAHGPESLGLCLCAGAGQGDA